MAQIQVTIVEGRNLKKKDFFSDNDSFVEIYLDDKNQKQKTRVLHNCKTPQWKQSFVLNHLQGQNTLHVDVYDEDKLKNDRIGSTQIDLKPVYEKRHLDQWFTITGGSRSTPQGEVRLIIQYQPLRV